jgi:hypothetical protein
VPVEHARGAIWVRPRLVGLVEFTGFTADGRLRLPRWRGPLDPAEVDEPRWARPADPPPDDEPDGTAPADAAAPDAPAGATAPTRAPAPAAAPGAAPEAGAGTDAGPTEERRLEQHFVYNSLNTIASLIRTDPGRARDLLVGFADLSRIADLPADATGTLARELDAVRGYLQLEQARFGRRLQVELDISYDAGPLEAFPVRPQQVLATVRRTVQRDIEPRPDGGRLSVSVGATPDGCRVTVQGPGGPPSVLVLSAAGAALPG